MKLVHVVMVSLSLALVFAGAWFAMLLAPPGPEPDWVAHYDAASRINVSENFSEFDRQAKLVLADAGRYGGKLPPQRNMSQEQKLFEATYFFVPFMQDRGETFSYFEALNELAKEYKRIKKWDDAELFYRKTMELGVAEEKRKNPRANPQPDYTHLISLMEESGRTEEAIRLQKEKLKSLEAYAAQFPDAPQYQSVLLEGQAKAFEMEGKFDEQESCLQKIVDLYKFELTPTNLAEKRIENARNPQYVNASLMNFQLLEPLESFYVKRGNYSGQEEVLLKKLSLSKAILPDNSKHLADDWEALERFYEQHGKYSQAEHALLEVLRLRGEKPGDRERLARVYENEGKHEQALDAMKSEIKGQETVCKDKNDLANCYMRYVVLLERLGKGSEAAQAKMRAAELDPIVARATMYTPPECNKLFWKKNDDSNGKSKP